MYPTTITHWGHPTPDNHRGKYPRRRHRLTILLQQNHPRPHTKLALKDLPYCLPGHPLQCRTNHTSSAKSPIPKSKLALRKDKQPSRLNWHSGKTDKSLWAKDWLWTQPHGTYAYTVTFRMCLKRHNWFESGQQYFTSSHRVNRREGFELAGQKNEKTSKTIIL